MRKILTLFTAIITILSLAANAQEKTGKVSGIIRDGGQKTIVSASIMLLRAKDSSVAKITLAGKDGSYQFEKIEDGNYLVSVTAVGHAKEYTHVFMVNSGKTITLNTIELVRSKAFL